MGFFNFDPTDPRAMELSGALSALSQAAMPSKYPVPFGAALGMAASGAMQGRAQAMQYQQQQQQLESSGIDLALKRAIMGPLVDELSRGNQGNSQAPEQAPNGAPAAAAADGGGAPPSKSGKTAQPSASIFDDYYSKFLAPEEGGYTASDGNGKPANFGINQGANPDVDVSKLRPDQAKNLTYQRYWTSSGAPYLKNPQLAIVQADTAFNMGPQAAWQLLQASGGDPAKYLALRAQRYQQIAQADPSKAAMLQGWMKRNHDLAQYLSGFDAQPENPQPGIANASNAAQAQANGTPGQQMQESTDGQGLARSLAMRQLFGGKDRYQTMRNGWAYDTWTNTWKHFPEMGEGITGQTGPDGQVTASVVPGELGALEQVEGLKAGIGAAAKKNVAGYNDFLETGGLGPTDASGNLKAQNIGATGPLPNSAQAPGAPGQVAPTAVQANPIVTGQGTKLPPISMAAPINQGTAYLAKRIPQWAETENDWNDALDSGYVAEQRAMAIADALKRVQSGQWTTEKADIIAKLRGVGIPVPNNVVSGANPEAVEEVLKNNFQSTLNQIRAFSSRPAAIEVQLAAKNFANPNLQPAANLQIIGETVGTLRWERAMLNDWAQAKQQGWQDPQDFQRAWTKLNPVQKFVDQTEKEIGPLKGMASSSQTGASTGTAAPPQSISSKPSTAPQGKQRIQNALDGLQPTDWSRLAARKGVSVSQLKAMYRASGFDVQ